MKGWTIRLLQEKWGDIFKNIIPPTPPAKVELSTSSCKRVTEIYPESILVPKKYLHKTTADKNSRTSTKPKKTCYTENDISCIQTFRGLKQF